MKLSTVFLIVIGTTIFSTATAHTEFVEGDYVCELSMAESIDCSENAIKVEKKRLNKIYMSIYRTLSAKQKLQLDKQQRAWLKERDKKCAFEHEGPINNMVVRQKVAADVCVANETQKRSKAITKKYKLK